MLLTYHINAPNPRINGLATCALTLELSTVEFTAAEAAFVAEETLSKTLANLGELSLANPNANDPTPTSDLPFPV